MDEDIELLRQALRLPEVDPWLQLGGPPATIRRRQRPADLPGQGRLAAVLCLIFPLPAQPPAAGWAGNQVPCDWEAGSEHRLGMILTRRAEHLGRHAGQISFPGGRQDPGESLEATARREAWEEIGVSPAGIQLLGRLGPIYVPPTDFTVHPYVGWSPRLPRLEPDTGEVDRLIVTSLEALADPAVLCRGEVRSGGKKIPGVPFFQVGQHQVWGATAAMISEMMARLEITRGGSEPR